MFHVMFFFLSFNVPRINGLSLINSEFLGLEDLQELQTWKRGRDIHDLVKKIFEWEEREERVWGRQATSFGFRRKQLYHASKGGDRATTSEASWSSNPLCRCQGMSHRFFILCPPSTISIQSQSPHTPLTIIVNHGFII